MTSVDKVCRFFKEGTCNKGNSCPFRHDSGGRGGRSAVHDDRGGGGKSRGVARGQPLRDDNKGRRAEGVRDDRGKALCRDFKAGHCARGQSCAFRHEGGGAKEGGGVGDDGSKRVCTSFAREGSCRFGESCHFLHVTEPAEFSKFKGTAIAFFKFYLRAASSDYQQLNRYLGSSTLLTLNSKKYSGPGDFIKAVSIRGLISEPKVLRLDSQAAGDQAFVLSTYGHFVLAAQRHTFRMLFFLRRVEKDQWLISNSIQHISIQSS